MPHQEKAAPVLVLLVLFLIAIASIAFAAFAVFPGPIAATVVAAAPFQDARVARIAMAFVFWVPAMIVFYLSWQWLRRRRLEQRVLEELDNHIAAMTGQETKRIDGGFSERFLADVDPDIKRQISNSTAGFMAKTLYDDALVHRFDPIGSIIERVRPRLTALSNQISARQTDAVRLGILGTFLGLMAALRDVPNIIDPSQNAEAAQNNRVLFDGLVNNLALAFGTSIAGLTAAVGIGILASLMRRNELHLLEGFESLAAKCQTLFRRRLAPDGELARTVKEMASAARQAKEEIITTRNALGEEATKLRETSAGLSAKSQKPAELLADNAEQLERLLERMRDSVKEAGALVGRITDAEERALKGLADSFGAFAKSQDDNAARIFQANTEAMETSLKEVKDFSQSLSSDIKTSLTDYAQSLRSAASDAAKSHATHEIDRRAKSLEDAIVAASREQASLLRKNAALLFLLYAGGVGGVLALSYFSPAPSPAVARGAPPALTSDAPRTPGARLTPDAPSTTGAPSAGEGPAIGADDSARAGGDDEGVSQTPPMDEDATAAETDGADVF